MMDISDMQKLVYFERLLLSWKIIIFTQNFRNGDTARQEAPYVEQLVCAKQEQQVTWQMRMNNVSDRVAN
jgi:hypothetical protein